jgi:hypothetical protein
VLTGDQAHDDELIRKWVTDGWTLAVVVPWRDEWHAFVMRWIDTPDERRD